MLSNSQIVFNKLNALNDKVKDQLRRKGLITPVKKPDGSIQVGTLKIVKKDNLFYVIDRYNNILAQNINLPHSAILIANDLGLSKATVNSTIEKDYRYGHYAFDELNLKAIITKTKDQGKKEILQEKLITSSLQKKKYKQAILEGFNKLLKIA